MDPKNGTMIAIVFEAEPVTGATGLNPMISLGNSLDKVDLDQVTLASTS